MVVSVSERIYRKKDNIAGRIAPTKSKQYYTGNDVCF